MKKIILLIVIFVSTNLQAINIVSIQGNGVNIRSSPKKGNNVITKAYRHNVFEKLDTSGRWVKVLLPDGKEGWVARKYTRDRSVDEVKVACREADILANSGAGLGTAGGWFGAWAICCGATALETAGFGCFACGAVGAVSGFLAGVKSGEKLGEFICDF